MCYFSTCFKCVKLKFVSTQPLLAVLCCTHWLHVAVSTWTEVLHAALWLEVGLFPVGTYQNFFHIIWMNQIRCVVVRCKKQTFFHCSKNAGQFVDTRFRAQWLIRKLGCFPSAWCAACGSIRQQGLKWKCKAAAILGYTSTQNVWQRACTQNLHYQDKSKMIQWICGWICHCDVTEKNHPHASSNLSVH